MTLDWLFVFDVDDTLTGDDQGLTRLGDALTTIHDRWQLVLNSSRPCASIRRTLRQKPQFPRSDWIIGALGTEIEHFDLPCKPLSEHQQRFEDGWDADQVDQLAAKFDLEAHSPEYLTPYKRSFYTREAVEPIWVYAALKAARLRVRHIYSAGGNLDIIPETAGKAHAIHYLIGHLKIRPEQVITAGDSENDLDMFAAPFRCITVGNAVSALRALQGEHIYHAEAHHAAGVLEGLRWWGVF